MSPAPPMISRARLLVGLAAAGAVPLTVGVVLWIVGTVMRLAYHGRWGTTASLGAALVLIGLVCGLVLFVFAAGGERRPPPGADLVPLASPEQQALLADRRHPPERRPPPER